MLATFGFLSEYSLQQSAYRLTDLLKDAKDNNYRFVAVNDFNNLYGAYKLFKLSKLPVIIGMKLDIIHFGEMTSILCYAMNEEGYKNLIVLSTMVQFKKDHRLEFNEVVENQKGLYFLSSGHHSDIDNSLLMNRFDEASERALSYKNNLKYFSLGLALQNMTQEVKVAPLLKRLSKELKVTMLPLNYMAYKKSDKDTYDAIIQIDDIDNKRVDNMDLSILSQEEIKTRYADYKEVFETLDSVIKHFTFVYQEPVFELPQLKEIKDSKKALIDLTIAGLNKKVKFKDEQQKQIYLNRLKMELEVIDELGFNNYFLIVWDFVSYAKKQGILVGPGRGSAAGSLVSFCLDITNVDPVKYGLLFERFLNKQRASMPDIDLDFPDDRREEVIDYIKNRYGSFHVLSINTFSRLSSKAAIRDICRIKGMSPYEINEMSKRLSTIPAQTELEKEIIRLSKKFDGLPRQTGTHAAGIVLGKEDLRYHIPLQPGPKLFQSQFDHEDLTEMGLLKIDLLGIRNLSIIMRVLELVEKHQKIKIDLDKIPFNDEKTYQLLQEGDTLGIFQMESAGMRNVLRKLKPNNFNDIVALLALYRPGPLQNIDLFINRRNGEAFEYLDPLLEPILKETYGIIVYQEQIMMIAQSFAGYSLSEADMLRVGISRKDKAILTQEKERFISKSIENNHSQKQAEEIYDYIVRFADYGFNKSHSVAYSLIAYQMVYLKANYYDIFMAVYLSMMGGTSNMVSIINLLKDKNINVLPPSINISTDEFIITEKGLIYPLTGIKSIGAKVCADIVSERETNGLYKSFDDLKERLSKTLNDRLLDALIFSGALDEFGKNKQTLVSQKEHSTSLYRSLLSDIKEVKEEEYDELFLARKEKEVLGFNLTKSPLEGLTDIIEKFKLTPLNNIHNKLSAVNTAGQISRIKIIKTRKNETMAFVTLTDYIVYVDVTVFANQYERFKDLLVEGKLVMVRLNYQSYNNGSWILENIKEKTSKAQ